MTKIAVIVSPKGISDAGGVERVMLYVRQALRRQAYTVILLDSHFLAHSTLGRTLAFLLNGRRGFFWQSLLLSYFAEKYRRRGAFVIANGYSSFLARADLLFSHGSMHGFRVAKAESLENGKRWKLKLFGFEEFMEMIAGQRAKKVLAVSPNAAREWQRYYRISAKKIRMLPNTVDTAHFKPKDSILHASAGEPDSGGGSDRLLRVLFVGRLEWMKGIDKVKAFAEYCHEQHLPVRFTLVAPDARGSEHFMHLPNLSIKIGIPYAQMPDIYTACDVVYFPSRYEGFEMITLEALACGIPVVGSRVGAIGYLLDKKFPGVYPAFTQGSEHLHGVLMHAAEEWSNTPRKYTLHEMVEKEFGIAKWSGRLLEIMGEAHV